MCYPTEMRRTTRLIFGIRRDPSRGGDGRTLVVTIRRFKPAWQAIQRILLQQLPICRDRSAT